MKEFAVYTALRLGLFLASYAVVLGVWALLRLPGILIWPILLAAVVSAVASYRLLKAPRERFAAKVDERATRATARFEQARAKEDRD